MKSPHVLETAVHDLKQIAEKLHIAPHPKENAAAPAPTPPKSEHPVRDRVEKAILNLPGTFPLP